MSSTSPADPDPSARFELKPAGDDAIKLSIGQQFEIERMTREIDATKSVQELQGLAKQLLHAWFSQKAATIWVMKQNMTPPSITVPGDREPD